MAKIAMLKKAVRLGGFIAAATAVFVLGTYRSSARRNELEKQGQLN